MRALAGWIWVACLACVCTLSRHASANGRFPEAQCLLEYPGDPNRLYLAATYGLLETEDRGKNWSFICEQSFALKSLEGDPLLEVMPGGKLLGGMQEGINLSSDCGCNWAPTLGDSTHFVLDLTLDSQGTAIALVQDVSTFPGHLRLFESSDEGRSWRKFSDLPSDIPDGYTVDVAPSDSSRVYVSAYAPDLTSGVLAVSKDRGLSWATLPILGTNTSAAPYIGAVHPTNPDLVFVRTRAWDDTADFAAQDALLVSSDAGATWSEALHRQATLLGFALSPDGKTVLAGYGDSVTAGFSTNPDDFGIYKASVSDLSFDKIFDRAVTCLRWTGSGLYACTLESGVAVTTPGMTVGFAPSADFTLDAANPFVSLLDLKNVRGPAACSAALCSDPWQFGSDSGAGVAVCQQIGAACDADAGATPAPLTCPPAPIVDAGAAGMDAGSDAAGGPTSTTTGGYGGASGTSDMPTIGNAGSAGGAVARASTPAPPRSDSCGCRVPGQQAAGAAAPLLLLVGLLGFAVRRRKSRLARDQRLDRSSLSELSRSGFPIGTSDLPG